MYPKVASHYAEQASLEFRDLPAFVFWVLELNSYATTPSSLLFL